MNSITVTNDVLEVRNAKGELVFSAIIVPGTEEWGTDLSNGGYQQNISSHQVIGRVEKGGTAIGLNVSNLFK